MNWDDEMQRALEADGEKLRQLLVAQFWTTPSAEDARLMAAAPELLEALKEANAFILAPAEDIKEGVLSRIRAVIAKAEARDAL